MWGLHLGILWRLCKALCGGYFETKGSARDSSVSDEQAGRQQYYRMGDQPLAPHQHPDQKHHHHHDNPDQGGREQYYRMDDQPQTQSKLTLADRLQVITINISMFVINILIITINIKTITVNIVILMDSCGLQCLEY